MGFLQCGSTVHHYLFRQGRLRQAVPKDPVLVFINGLGTDHRIWDAVLEALPTELSVLRYDLRGQGLSERGQGRYDVATLSSDLEQLLGRVGATSVVPVGFSLGGLVAQQFALAHPARVRGLVLCATGARIGSAETWMARAAQVRQGGLAPIAESVMERWFSKAYRERQPERVRAFRTLLERSDVPSYLAALELLAHTDLSATLEQLSVPTLVVAGGADLATPPEQARELAGRIPGAQVRVLAGAGHLLGVEQPEAVARCLSEFLRQAGLWTADAAGQAAGPGAAAASSVAAEESSWARGMEVRRAVLGDAHVDRSTAAATDFDRDFQSYITRMAWGEIWTRPGLPLHTRQLLTIVMLATLNRQEELAMHLEATRNTGLSPEQVREALMHVAVYAGVPAAHAAIEIAKRVLFQPAPAQSEREVSMVEPKVSRYQARDAGAHPSYLSPRYASSIHRSPRQPLVIIPQSLSELTGPVFGHSIVSAGDADLTTNAGTGAPALGERIIVSGRVLEQDGRPVPNTLLEIWQCNAAGRYPHVRDTHDAPVDPNFLGAGRLLTDAEGRYSFTSIKPGAYPWRNNYNAWRPAHIHFSLFGPALLTRLVTQMYFPGDPLLPLDGIYMSIPDPAARERLVASFDPDRGRPNFALGYRFDIVLRGREETPAEGL